MPWLPHPTSEYGATFVRRDESISLRGGTWLRMHSALTMGCAEVRQPVRFYIIDIIDLLFPGILIY